MQDQQSLSDLPSRKKIVATDYGSIPRENFPHVEKLDHFVELLNEIGFSCDNVKVTYVTGDYSTYALSIDLFTFTRSLCLEVFLDINSEDSVKTVIKTYRVHSDNGLVDSSAYTRGQTYGPYSNSAQMLSDYELYEDLRRLAHQMECVTNETRTTSRD